MNYKGQIRTYNHALQIPDQDLPGSDHELKSQIRTYDHDLQIPDQDLPESDQDLQR